MTKKQKGLKARINKFIQTISLGKVLPSFSREKELAATPENELPQPSKKDESQKEV